MAANDGLRGPVHGLFGETYSTGAPGSQATGLPDASALPDTAGTHGDSAFITPVLDSIVSGDRVTVGPLDTLVGGQADLYGGTDPNLLSSVPGVQAGNTGAGVGSVQGAGNPNAVPIGDLSSQINAARRPS
jgi:hypothetical protein